MKKYKKAVTSSGAARNRTPINRKELKEKKRKKELTAQACARPKQVMERAAQTEPSLFIPGVPPRLVPARAQPHRN